MYRIVGEVEGVRTEGARTSLRVRDRRARRSEWYPLAPDVPAGIRVGDWVEVIGGQDPNSLDDPLPPTVRGQVAPEGPADRPRPETLTLGWKDHASGEMHHQTVALPATIGRGSDATIVLSDRMISRSHARIEREGEQIMLTNLGANGTSVNGRPEERAALEDGDTVTVGPFHLLVQRDVPAQSEGAAAPEQEAADAEQPAEAPARSAATIPAEAMPDQSLSAATVAEEAVAPEPAIAEAALPEAAMPEAALAEAMLPLETLPEEAMPEAAAPEPAMPVDIPAETLPEAVMPEQATVAGPATDMPHEDAAHVAAPPEFAPPEVAPPEIAPAPEPMAPPEAAPAPEMTAPPEIAPAPEMVAAASERTPPAASPPEFAPPGIVPESPHGRRPANVVHERTFTLREQVLVRAPRRAAPDR